MGISARNYYFENVWPRLVPEHEIFWWDVIMFACRTTFSQFDIWQYWRHTQHWILHLAFLFMRDVQVAAEVQNVMQNILLALESRYFLTDLTAGRVLRMARVMGENFPSALSLASTYRNLNEWLPVWNSEDIVHV